MLILMISGWLQWWECSSTSVHLHQTQHLKKKKHSQRGFSVTTSLVYKKNCLRCLENNPQSASEFIFLSWSWNSSWSKNAKDLLSCEDLLLYEVNKYCPLLHSVVTNSDWTVFYHFEVNFTYYEIKYEASKSDTLLLDPVTEAPGSKV